MITAPSANQEPIGFRARRVRIALRLTQQELADMTGVSKEDVGLFEHNLPVYLDARRKILKGLWSVKASRYANPLRI
jgi:transcriptional regulator with XRE-family HTH domain